MSLEISSPSRALPTSSPNLMPFHIEYSGPAPISRYFRPAPAPVTNATRDLTTELSSSSVVTLTEESASGTFESQSSVTSYCSVATSVTVVEATGLSEPMEMINAKTQPSAELDSADSSEPKLVAAFRGRRVVGQAVKLPDGYGGLVLQAPSLRSTAGNRSGTSGFFESPSAAKSKPVSTRRTTRRSARAGMSSEDATVEEAANSAEEDSQHRLPPEATRQLLPVSMFSSFTIWSPDIPVDEGKDEYMRTLIEWTKLAAEIHSCV
ncbi:ribonuclease H2, subunit C [Pisolithus croceorrhizus]|nr:ribonuclease H2, subunit C [Pisolithus sp. B1]KAI6122643.1 ribonuclease H2, subunit C [Pisolithus croceorrhizus]